MVWSSSISMPGRTISSGSLVAPNSMVVKPLDDLRDVKGRPTLGVAYGIPFLSHLWQCDSVVC